MILWLPAIEKAHWSRVFLFEIQLDLIKIFTIQPYPHMNIYTFIRSEMMHRWQTALDHIHRLAANESSVRLTEFGRFEVSTSFVISGFIWCERNANFLLHQFDQQLSPIFDGMVRQFKSSSCRSIRASMLVCMVGTTVAYFYSITVSKFLYIDIFFLSSWTDPVSTHSMHTYTRSTSSIRRIKVSMHSQPDRSWPDFTHLLCVVRDTWCTVR